MKKILLFSIFCLAFGADENAPLQRTRDREVDIIHSKIEITVDIISESVFGNVIHTLSPLGTNQKSFSLDADDIIIKRVSSKNRDLEFFYSDSKIIIDYPNPMSWQDTIDVRIDYSSKPRKGVYFIKPDNIYPDKPFQAWTQGEDMDNHHWVPLYDYPNDKATFETIITVSSELKAISNGELLSIKENQNGTTTWHWRENFPMVAYLISFAIGDYVKIEDDYNGIPVNYWVYNSNQDETMRSFGLTTDMMAYFDNVTGIKYPYEKYDQVILDDFMFGGMENITLTHNTDRTMHDQFAAPDVSSVGLVAHELIHQWYGNMITTRNWAHAWLNEGFATFFSRNYREYKFGYDEGEYIRFNEIKGYFNANRRWRRSTVQYNYYESMDVFDSHIYSKGSLILNMIHDFLGDDAFWRFIKHYTKSYQYDNVETPDLKKSIEEVTGKNMDWFFKQWVYEPGFPEYEVKWNFNQRNNSVKIKVSQIQDLSLNNLFKMPVRIQIDNNFHTIWVEEKKLEYEIPVLKRPKMVIFNAGVRIPCKVSSNKTLTEWIYQLRNAPHILDRITAINNLSNKKGRRIVEKALLDCIENDPFWGVRLEAVRGFAKLKSKKYAKELIELSFEQDNRVRREIWKALKNYEKDDMVITFLEDIIRNDQKYYSVSDAFRSLVSLDQKSAKSLVSLLLNRDSHNDVIRKSAISYFGKVKNDENYQRLIELSAYGGTTWDARAEAVNQLGNYAKSKPETLDYFIGFLEDKSRDVRRNAVRNIGKYGNETHLANLDEILIMDPILSRSIRRAKKQILNSKEKEGIKNFQKELKEAQKIINDVKKIVN